MAKMAYICLNLSPNKSSFNQYYPKSVPNPDILIILQPKNDYFSYLSIVNQLH